MGLRRSFPGFALAWWGNAFRHRLPVALAFGCVATGVAAATSTDPDFPFGEIVPVVACRADPGQSYALFLPTNFTPDRTWPILYCFDPRGRGEVPVKLFQAAAARRGYIVVGSHNARNGPWSDIAAAIRAIVADTEARFPLDRRRRYAAGFSGGARAACAAAETAGFAGVVGCSGGFRGGTVPTEVNFAHFGTAGIDDFNFGEMQGVASELERRHTPHRLAIFAGTHEWPPDSLARDALAWFDVLAMRNGTLARDAAFLDLEFARRLRTARAETDASIRFVSLGSIEADFAGLRDVSEVTRERARLQDSPGLRRAQRAARKSLQREEDWFAALREAINGRDIPEPERSATVLPTIPRADPLSAEPAAGDVVSPFAHDPSHDSWLQLATQFAAKSHPVPFARLRRLAADLRRRGAKDPAARRALASAYAGVFEEGLVFSHTGKLPPASQCFEAATILLPDRSGPYFEWASICLAQNEHARARELLEAATARGFDETTHIARLRATLDPPAAASPARPTHTSVEAPTIALAAPTTDFALPEIEASHAAVPLPNNPDVLQMAAMRVAGQPVTGFGIALRIFAVPGTKQIARIVIDRVVPDTDAARENLAPGDEIVRIEGRSIHAFAAVFERDSDFGRLFVGRKHGDRITLEIAPSSGSPPRTVTLTEARWNSNPFPWERHRP